MVILNKLLSSLSKVIRGVGMKKEKYMITYTEGIKVVHDCLMEKFNPSVEVEIEFVEGDDYSGLFEIYVIPLDNGAITLMGKITLAGVDGTYSIPHYIHEFTHLYKFSKSGEDFEYAGEDYHPKEFYEVLNEVIKAIKEVIPDFEYPLGFEYPGAKQMLDEIKRKHRRRLTRRNYDKSKEKTCGQIDWCDYDL